MTKKQFQRILRIVLAIGTITSLFFVPWIVLWAWIQPLPDTVQEQADKAISYGFDGIVLYIDQSGRPPSYSTAGWHDRKKEIPAKPDALFKIASISKLYNAVAITKLAHNKQLLLDNTLADFFPELVGRIENAEKITVRMMIQHTSGIPNYTDTFNYWAHPKESNEENLALVLDLPAKFEPGEDYEYSNTNYLLLSEIMDKVLGYDHFQYIQEEILNRLHLKNTFSSVKKVDSNRVMSGYHVGYPLDLKTDNTGMVASAEDVGKFIRALNDGSLFDEGEQDIYSSLYRYGHTGLVPGYQSIARYHRDIDAVVVQFTGPTNFEGYNWNLSEIMYNRIIKILTNQE
ncbi:serine hydrolase domain-containing protein [Luteirhabdus pelagi]|uniref:serine hydrolase domain-containing protein n=1 Tax=Luteirhabdus pelagi TaxID=2792783 RepID=UPI00193A95B3|nr:serine hydrolase domain-containing protein [Luteirhabdus pelagi]